MSRVKNKDANRKVAMVEMYLTGATFQEVGEKFGVSRQRAAQIIRGRTMERHMTSLRRQERDSKIQEAYDRILAGETTLEKEAEYLGVLPDSLRAYMNRKGLRLPKKTVPLHGTRHRYNQGCRCAECRESVKMYQRTLIGREPPRHGTPSAYTNYGCRCDLCRMAGSAHNRAYRERRKERERLLHGVSAGRGRLDS